MRGASENIFLLRHRISKESRFSLLSMGETEMEVTTIDSTKKFKENMPRSWQKKMWLVKRIQLTSFDPKNVTLRTGVSN